MPPLTFRQTVLRVMGLRTIELITLLCLLHWTMHFFLTPIPLRFPISEVEQQSAQEQAPDYRQEVWAIALAVNALLYLPMKSLATLMEKELLSPPLSTAALKHLLLLLLLAVAQLALLVGVHRMTI